MTGITDGIIKTLAMFGAVALGGVLILFVVMLIHALYEKILDIKWTHKYKHRFDKKPTAACYCIDCDSWNPKNHSCKCHDGWYTADNWFCWDANPRKKESYE